MFGKKNLNKETTLFMKAVKAIGFPVRKADEPVAPETVPDGADQPDTDALAAECVEALDSGELTADPAKVAEWAKTKGMSEEDAADFAEAVLTEYFNEGEAEEPAGEEMPEGSDEVAEMAKSLKFWAKAIDGKLAEVKNISENLGIMLKGLSIVVESNKELQETNKLMKASLEKLGLMPAGKPATIIKAADPTKAVEGMSFSEKKSIILKGAMAGAFDPREVSAWESSLGRIESDRIKKYIQENK